MNRIKLNCLLAVLLLGVPVFAADGGFSIIENGASVPVVYDDQDAEVVGIAISKIYIYSK